MPPHTFAVNEPVTSTTLQAELGSTAWTAVTFTNSWVNFAAYQTAQYRLVGDMVQIRGVISTGTLNTAAFTLPAGFRPPVQQIFPSVANAAVAVLIVTAAGVVNPQTGSNVWFSVLCQFSVTS